jgi:TolB-like protein/DNA-binding winged helix-turn-helix (wHTH) protein/Tfp pilus assembly protein PilF
VQDTSQTRRVLRFGAFEVDLSSGELQKHGTKIRLQEQPFQILAMLLDRPGEVVAREDLRRKLWPSDTFVDFDVGLNNAILRLRSTLGDSAEKPRFIETLPRRGYRFIAAVHNGGPAAAQTSVVSNSTLAAPAEAGAQTAEFTSAARRPSSILWISITAFAVVLALLLGFSVQDVRNRLLGKPGLPRIHSIAVLPLENLSGDPAQEFLADGMTDALITDLAQIGALRVISRTSVMQYKGARKLVPQIAEDLKVDAVVEGTVTRSENRVRITAQLIEGGTDRHLWARTYERDLIDILALQDDVARGIATEIQAKLTPQDQSRLAKKQKVDPAAYEAYVKGRLIWNRLSTEEATKALRHFQQAVAIDPNYAPAYSGLSDSYRTLALFSGHDRDVWRKARAAATRALELDDSLAEAHRSLAPVLLWYDWDLAASERENQRALELNPGDAESYRVYGTFLYVTGRSNEAIAMNRRAQELDPFSPANAVNVAMGYFSARQYDQAIKACQKALELDPAFIPAHRWLGLTYEGQGKFPEAIAEFKLTVELSPGNQGYLENLARLYAVAGKTTEARRILAQLRGLSKTRYVSPLQFGLIYAALGERDQAFAWLEKALEDRNGSLLALSTAPWFDPLRSDPRFTDLVRRIGLAVKQAENPANKISE